MTHAGVQGPAVSTRNPGRLGPGSKCRQDPSALPGASGPCPKSHSVDQISQANQARVQGPRDRSDVPGEWPCVRGAVASSSCPGRIWPVLGRSRSQPAVPGNWARFRGPTVSTSCPGQLGLSSKACRVDQMSLATPARVRVTACRPAVSGDSGMSSRSCSVEQLPRAPWARVQGPPVSTSCPGLLTLVSEGLQDRPALLGDSGP